MKPQHQPLDSERGSSWGVLVLERGQQGRVRNVPPGAISALLLELARAPVESVRGWLPSLHPGQVVGRFELLREIGSGGFGVVYEARDQELGRTVAFKAVRAGERVELKEERLLREAEAAARLSHPNIVTLFDVGRCEEGPYLVLEMLHGRTLAERLAQGPVPLREALRTGLEVSKGLAHAHAQGVIHRDLTPGNVFLCEDGQVKVLDFGMAHAFGQRKLDGGTRAYMAPEQERGAPEDERTDVFALGVILHHMLSGELPFPADGKRLQGSRPAPALEVLELPPLGELVGRMLEKDPVKRPRDAGEALSALTAIQQSLDRTPAPVEGSPSPRVRRRHKARWRAVLVAGAVLGAGIAATVVHRRPITPPAPSVVTVSRPIVAVADFVNGTQDQELDGLSIMLITSLEQSHHLAVLTRSRMVALAKQLGKESQHIDEVLGREIAARAGAKTLVLASLHRFGEVYAMDLLAVDPSRNEYLFALNDKARGKSGVPALIDRLSQQARERLREKPDDVKASQVMVAAATSPSFEAYQHYFRGQQLEDDPAAAMQEYRKAVDLDPGFALAQCQIAYLGEFVGLPQPVRAAALKSALQHLDRLPEKERQLVLAWNAQVEGREDEAHEIYRRVSQAYPDDRAVHFFAGDLLFHSGRSAEAAVWFDRAFALDPTWSPTLGHLPIAFAAAGRSEELLARAQRRVEQTPSATGERLLGAALLATGRWGDAAEAYRRALANDGSEESRTQLAATLTLLDRYAEAEEVARQGAVGVGLLNALAYQGRRREALAVIEAVGGEGSKAAIYRARRLVHFLGDGNTVAARREAAALGKAGLRPDRAAVLLAMAGDLDAAATQVRKLSPRSDIRALVDAVGARQRGERGKALERLRPLAGSREADCAALALLTLGEMAFEDGRDADAVQALEGFRTASALFMTLDSSGNYRTWAYPRSLYLIAAARHRLGEDVQARAALEQLLELWKRADQGMPLLREAKALQRELKA